MAPAPLSWPPPQMDPKSFVGLESVPDAVEWLQGGQSLGKVTMLGRLRNSSSCKTWILTNGDTLTSAGVRANPRPPPTCGPCAPVETAQRLLPLKLCLELGFSSSWGPRPALPSPSRAGCADDIRLALRHACLHRSASRTFFPHTPSADIFSVLLDKDHGDDQTAQNRLCSTVQEGAWKPIVQPPP